jgi:hypothetical protein
MGSMQVLQNNKRAMVGQGCCSRIAVLHELRGCRKFGVRRVSLAFAEDLDHFFEGSGNFGRFWFCIEARCEGL